MGRVSSAESSETQVLDHHFCKMTKYVIILHTGKLHNIQQTRYLLFYYTLQRLFTVITSSNKGTTTTTTRTTTCFTLRSPPLLQISSSTSNFYLVAYSQTCDISHHTPHGIPDDRGSCDLQRGFSRNFTRKCLLSSLSSLVQWRE